MISQEHNHSKTYLSQGYVVFSHYIPNHVCETLKWSAERLVQELDPSQLPDEKLVSDPNFQWESYYDKIKQRLCVFLHHQKSKSNSTMQYKDFLVKKISYALHQEHNVFKEFSFSSLIKQLLSVLSITNPLILQTMFLAKHPGIEERVMCHQDASYFCTGPQSLVALWIALDDFTKENGCLYVLPEAHHLPLKFRLVRAQDGTLQYSELDRTPWELEKMIPLEVKKGSVIVLDGMLPHMSLPNCASLATHAFSMHIVSKDSQYSKANWLQPSEEYPFCSVDMSVSECTKKF